MIYTLEEFEAHRKNRFKIQRELMDEFNMPLLFMKVNYPCTVKDNLLSKDIIIEMDRLLADIHRDSIQYKLFSITAEGPNSIMLINESAESLKKTAVFIQDNHILGRVMHISVYNNETGIPVTREEIGLPKRKCILCEDFAENCIKLNRHSREEIIREINRSYIEYLETFFETVI